MTSVGNRHDEDPMEVDATKQIKIRKNTRGARKKFILINFTQKRQQNTHDLKTNVEILSKSKVTEISESDHSKQVDETWTCEPSSSLSQKNTIRCADERLFRQHNVNWTDQSDCKTEEHEFMINCGCFGHVCPHLFAPKILMVSFTNVETVEANNVQHCGQKKWFTDVCRRSVTDEF